MLPSSGFTRPRGVDEVNDINALAVGLTFGVTAIVTIGVLQASKYWRIMDVPNERSAHSTPTPTLGGIAISAGIAAGLLTTDVPGTWLWPLLLTLCVLLVSVVDDLGRPMRVGRKLLLQLAASGTWVGLAPSMPIQLTQDWVLASGPATAVLTIVWLLWLMNMFNFMDGIDGLTTSQATVMSLGLSLVLVMTASPIAVLPVVMIPACLCFLLFNAPPARIFMADVGSLSLGFLLGTVTLTAAAHGVSLWLSALPLAGYAIDTSYTIFRRLLRRENVLQAHNQHLYQQLVQSGWSQLQVDGAALVISASFSCAALFELSGQHILSGVCMAMAVLGMGAGLWWKERRSRG